MSGFGASFPGVIRSMLLGSSGDGLAALFLPFSSRFFSLGTAEAFCPTEACVLTGAGSAALGSITAAMVDLSPRVAEVGFAALLPTIDSI